MDIWLITRSTFIGVFKAALEADAKEYALNNLSSLAPSTRYKFNLIKAAKALGMPDSDIFRGYRAPNRELSLNLKKLSLNPRLSTDIDKQNELYGKVNIEIPNFRVYDNLFDISNIPIGNYVIYITTTSNITDIAELTEKLGRNLDSVTATINNKKDFDVVVNEAKMYNFNILFNSFII